MIRLPPRSTPFPYTTLFPYQHPHGDGERWRLRLEIGHTNRFVQPLCLERQRPNRSVPPTGRTLVSAGKSSERRITVAATVRRRISASARPQNPNGAAPYGSS